MLGKVSVDRCAMHAMRRNVRPTGLMLEVDNELSPYPPLERDSVPRNGIRELQNVPGDGDCLYHSLARMYEHTIVWPLGQVLQTRMQVVAAQYSPGTTFAPTARYLRTLFLDFLREHWDHYYSKRAFRDVMLHVARKDEPGLAASNSMGIRRAYIQRMSEVFAGGRAEWGGPVECDIASELFGMRITLWVDLPEEPHSYWLNNEFLPQLLAGSVDPNMSAWRWELVQTGMVHFQYFQPWLADPEPIPQTGASVMDALEPTRPRATRRVRWADQVNQYQAGAMEKIRSLIARGLRYTWDEFKLWFELNFTIRGVAARLSALHLFYAAYSYLNSEAPAGGATSQLPPFTPFMQGPSMGRSVVDEVFAKHARFAPR